MVSRFAASPWGEGVCDSRRMRGSYINETQNISFGICLRQGFPLGGKLLAKQGDEGRLNYLLKVFKQATNPAPFANLYSIAIYDLSGNFCVTFGITKDRMPFSYFALMSSFETSSPT